ncbi:hypothetical protein B0I35DRAFT_498605 [Stachybotrys elegans]|uniref:Rhodopsin domain-containing protein n=1 Tax=Stachybotrys elegans TaxID=80388 RepID=A0A8K0SD91_9HYPO|nr:hypothetical protein B0I35DRAFT_498605 [Stachybotrys elegans]
MSTEMPATHGGIAPHYHALFAVDAVAIAVSAVCLVLRFIQQRRTWGALWWDDWTCLGAMIVSCGLLPVWLVSKAGHHIWTYTFDDLSQFLKTLFVLELLYSSSICLAKLSVLFLYTRLFSVVSIAKVQIYVLFFLVVAFWLSSIFGVIFTYDPVYAAWEPWIPHTMINMRDFYLATGSINTCLDLAILIFPQTMVWKIQMSTKKKFLISMLFLLGALVCTASVARIVCIVQYDETDLTSDVGNMFLWTVLEPSLAIICCCLPVIYKLFKRNRWEIPSSAEESK